MTKHKQAVALDATLSALIEALSVIDYMRAGDGSLPLGANAKLERARSAIALAMQVQS